MDTVFPYPLHLSHPTYLTHPDPPDLPALPAFLDPAEHMAADGAVLPRA
jgi:hypothetical protein